MKESTPADRPTKRPTKQLVNIYCALSNYVRFKSRQSSSNQTDTSSILFARLSSIIMLSIHTNCPCQQQLYFSIQASNDKDSPPADRRPTKRPKQLVNICCTLSNYDLKAGKVVQNSQTRQVYCLTPLSTLIM